MLTNLNSVFNVKALVGAFNQEKALVGAFSVIVQPVVEPLEHYTALMLTVVLLTHGRYAGGFSASLSSAIASMVGAPRILQAVGKVRSTHFC